MTNGPVHETIFVSIPSLQSHPPSNSEASDRPRKGPPEGQGKKGQLENFLQEKG